MNRNQLTAAVLLVALPLASSCASYSAYQKARSAETSKSWDEAVTYYEKALLTDPGNTRFRMARDRAKLEASRVHFEKGKTLRAAAATSKGSEQIRLAQMAGTELELTVRLDPTNQFAAVELGKVVQLLSDITRTADDNSIEERKKRQRGITKAQPPVLNPASDQPISLNFARETPVKDIYRALGNAFGINILFDQAVKDDRISIELKDVTAQQALERVMQAANHFYKVLDEHTIIVVPDNPQARRDYEDLVIRTFYLSNGDAEQVTNVVRTMIEARNVFPLKALNAITIRDTADKVRIAEKIIEANDKAKAEVVVDVELLQLDATRLRDLGPSFGSYSLGATLTPPTTTGADGKTTTGPITLPYLQQLNSGSFTFTVPTSVTVNLVKNITDSEQLANPELRISEGEKATLHIGKRIPVPVSTFAAANTTGAGNTFAPVTSFQYQDVGIKVSIEPRVHHNREVTLKLTVEVSDQSGEVRTGEGSPAQPIISTRTIESTIRLKDGETNFLAGLIQRNDTTSQDRTPFLGDIPVLGRVFNHDKRNHNRTDLMLTMTPHIVRIPDITDDDMAPMWVGTTNNLTFRGVSPRIESQSNIDPFNGRGGDQFGADGPNARPSAGSGPSLAPGANSGMPSGMTVTSPGTGPTDPFAKPANPGTGQPQSSLTPPQGTAPGGSTKTASVAMAAMTSQTDASAAGAAPRVETTNDQPAISEEARLRLSPRLAPQPANLGLKPGEEKIWQVIGMDLDGLTTNEILFHFDPRTIDVAEVMFGAALAIDLKTPPVARINRDSGTIRIASTDGKPLQFTSGGEVVALRVRGIMEGETFLVLENPDLRRRGAAVASAISGGRAKVE